MLGTLRLSRGERSTRPYADAKADKIGMVRVIDESGEDYLYPRNFFSQIRVSPTLAKALASTT